jgi:hypothetical protein
MRKLFTDYEMMRAFITKIKIESDVARRKQIDPRHYHVLKQIFISCEHYLLEMEEEKEYIQADLVERGYTESEAYKMWRAGQV